tara:strand:- start:33 stop:908 length:876 start_codon:yes stop_codon:yes gene_type:complete
MTFNKRTPLVKLNDGYLIPQLGFGVYQIDKKDTVKAVEKAFDCGYKHIDTAKSYGNEKEVGDAIRAQKGHIYVTTKYFNPDTKEHGYEDALAHFEQSYRALGLKHIDLYLIHWPIVKNDGYAAAWKALIELQKSDRVKSIGVSNFTQEHISRIIEETSVVPAVNQIEMHPYFQQEELRAFHKKHDILTEAWSPLGRGKVLDDKVLNDIAKDHHKTAAQIVLRWHMQLGVITFPKSTTPERIEENYAIFDFELSKDEMAAIKALEKGERNGPDPAVYTFPEDLLRKRAASKK